VTDPKEEVMMTFRRLGILVAVLVLSVALAGAAGAGEKRYDGVTLRVMLPDGWTEAKPVSELLIEAGKMLGADVKVSWYSMDELHDKALIDFTAGNKSWDILAVQSYNRAEWADMGLIVPMGTYIAQHPELVDKAKLALDDYYDISIKNYTHKGVWLGPPLYVTGVALFYRADLFNNAEEKRNFKAKYGYDLKEPATYKEFRDIAEFFTRKAGQRLAGQVLTSDFYGTSHSDKPVGFLWSDFVNYLVAYGADDVYDPKTMRPTLNSPQAVAAGNFMASLVPSMPPGHLNFTSGESTAVFASGNVAMIIEYFLRCTDMVLNPAKSKVADKAAFTVLPSVPGVTGREHAAHHGGNFLGLYSLSSNMEAAYKVIELAFSKEVMRKVYLEKYVPYGWIPPRPSILRDPEIQKRVPWMKEALTKLMDRKDIYYFEQAPLPEYFRAMDAAATALHKAMSTGTTVNKGFDEAQKEAEALFKKAGYIK
jgi:multiple sugar transport system substrate-binding protein